MLPSSGHCPQLSLLTSGGVTAALRVITEPADEWQLLANMCFMSGRFQQYGEELQFPVILIISEGMGQRSPLAGPGRRALRTHL